MKKLSIKFLSLILIMTIIFSFIQVFFIKSEVNAALSNSYTQYIKSGINAFPESYQKKLAYLKYLHPDWEFRAYYTGINWDELTSSSAENACLKNTIHKGYLLDPVVLCKCGRMGDTSYYCASAKTVNYYIDPRNFMGEAMIFQFLDLSNGSGVTKDVVDKATSGTYLNQYVDDIIAAAAEAQINPLHIVATIYQEIGKGEDGVPRAISGNVTGYEGLYNFYNYGATDGEGAVERGLAKAKELNWTSPRFALVDGAKRVLANGYISAGQTTKYFYKFDVVGNEILTEEAGQRTYSIDKFYSHQYMTNLRDPSSQAGMLYDIYAENGILDEKLTFTIPVYNNMPEQVDVPTSLTEGNLYYINSLKKYGVTFRASAGGESLGNIYKDTIVILLENQGYWSKVKINRTTDYDVTNKKWNYIEQIGYVATEYLAKVGTDIPDYRDQVNMGTGSTGGNNQGTITGNAEYRIDGIYMRMTPSVTAKMIKSENDGAIIKTIDGTDISNTEDLVPTGATIEISGNKYTVVKMGDVNGDGFVDTGDTFFEKQVVMKVKVFEEIYEIAGDVNQDGYIDTGDTFILKKQVMKIENIKI